MALFRRKSDDERDPEAVARWDALQNMLDAQSEPERNEPERPRDDAPAPPEMPAPPAGPPGPPADFAGPPPWQQQEPWRHHEVGPDPAPQEMNGHAAAEPAAPAEPAGWDSWDSVISSTSFDEIPNAAPEPPAAPAYREPEPEESTVESEPAPDPGAGLISSGVPWNSARIVLPARPSEPESPASSDVSRPEESADREPVEETEQPEPITWSAAPIADPGSLSWVEPGGSLESAQPVPADPRLTARPGPQSFDLPEHVRRNETAAEPAAEPAQEASPAAEPRIGPGQIPPQQFPPPPPQQFQPPAPMPGPPPPPPQQWQPPQQWSPPANQPPQWQPPPPPQQQWPVPPPPVGAPVPLPQQPSGPVVPGPATGSTPQAGPPTGPTPQAGPTPQTGPPTGPTPQAGPAPRAGEPPQPPETPPFVWTDDFESGPNPAVQNPPAADQPVQNRPAPNQAPPGHFAPALPPGPYQPGTQDPAPYVHRPGPSVDDLTASALVDRRSTPQAGWRKAVYRISAHAVNPGISRGEQRRRELINQATVPVHGCYRIAVISLKGGVGKTTTTVCLGATLASLRGDRVIAVDANPDRGTLSGKIPVQTTATVRNLLNDVDRIERYSDVRRYTSQSPDRLEVLASESDPSVSLAFSEADYRRVAGVLERYYNVVLTDCGTGLLHSAMAGVLAMANQLVVVSSGSVDGARSASATIDWLEAHGYSRLVAGSVAVINSVRPKSGGVNLDALEEHFASRCRAVTRIPYDPHLELGAEVDLAELAAPTREALLELAADVAAGFPRPEGPPPPPMQPYEGPR